MTQLEASVIVAGWTATAIMGGYLAGRWRARGVLRKQREATLHLCLSKTDAPGDRIPYACWPMHALERGDFKLLSAHPLAGPVWIWVAVRGLPASSPEGT